MCIIFGYVRLKRLPYLSFHSSLVGPLTDHIYKEYSVVTSLGKGSVLLISICCSSICHSLKVSHKTKVSLLERLSGGG